LEVPKIQNRVGVNLNFNKMSKNMDPKDLLGLQELSPMQSAEITGGGDKKKEKKKDVDIDADIEVGIG